MCPPLENSTLEISESRIDKLPSVEWGDLVEPNNMASLLEALGWIVDQLAETNIIQ